MTFENLEVSKEGVTRDLAQQHVVLRWVFDPSRHISRRKSANGDIEVAWEDLCASRIVSEIVERAVFALDGLGSDGSIDGHSCAGRQLDNELSSESTWGESKVDSGEGNHIYVEGMGDSIASLIEEETRRWCCDRVTVTRIRWQCSHPPLIIAATTLAQNTYGDPGGLRCMSFERNQDPCKSL